MEKEYPAVQETSSQEVSSGGRDSVNDTQAAADAKMETKRRLKNLGFLGKTVLGLIIAIAAFSLLNFVLSFFEGTGNDAIAAAQASLRMESNMVFVEQEYKRVFFIKNTTQTMFSNRTDNEMLLSVNYTLQAGINLSDVELREEDVALVVTYRQPQIFRVAPDYASINLMYGERFSTIFNANPVRFSHFLPVINGGVAGMPSMREEGQVISEEIAGIEEIAIQNGVLDMVRNNAEWWFSSYLGLLGFTNIRFEARQ